MCQDIIIKKNYNNLNLKQENELINYGAYISYNKKANKIFIEFLARKKHNYWRCSKLQSMRSN